MLLPLFSIFSMTTRSERVKDFKSYFLLLGSSIKFCDITDSAFTYTTLAFWLDGIPMPPRHLSSEQDLTPTCLYVRIKRVFVVLSCGLTSDASIIITKPIMAEVVASVPASIIARIFVVTRHSKILADSLGARLHGLLVWLNVPLGLCSCQGAKKVRSSIPRSSFFRSYLSHLMLQLMILPDRQSIGGKVAYT